MSQLAMLTFMGLLLIAALLYVSWQWRHDERADDRMHRVYLSGQWGFRQVQQIRWARSLGREPSVIDLRQVAHIGERK